jgi:hypothetical protein
MGPSGSFRFSIAMFDLVGSDVIQKHAVAGVDIGQRSAPGLAAIDINHCARVSARQSPARSPQCRMLHISSAEKLCDGRLVEVRALRPDDELGMLAALKETSAQSLQRRFFVNGNATFANGSALPSWNPICGQLYDRPRWSVRCVRTSRGRDGSRAIAEFGAFLGRSRSLVHEHSEHHDAKSGLRRRRLRFAWQRCCGESGGAEQSHLDEIDPDQPAIAFERDREAMRRMSLA